MLLAIIVSSQLKINQTQSSQIESLTHEQSHHVAALNTSTVDYLIITPSKYGDVVQPLAQWKRQKGLITDIITLATIQTSYSGADLPAQIKNCIQDYYTNARLRWVLLVGDHDELPSRLVRIYDDYTGDGDYIASDFYYAELNNNWDSDGDSKWGERNQDNYDYEAEVYVGRLPANDASQMAKLVDNIITYEKNPTLGDWLTRSMYAGAFANFAQDYNNDSIADWPEFDANRFNNYLRQQTLPDNWTSITMGETAGIKPTSYPYDLPLTETNTVNTLNQGNGIGMLSAHGGPTGISRYTFEVDYDGDGLFDYDGDPYYENGDPVDKSGWSGFLSTTSNLNSNGKRGMYWISACYAGSFSFNYETLAEYVLDKVAIGVIASSHVSWYEDGWTEREHGGWFNEGNAFRFFEQLLTEGHNQPGKALALARADYWSDRIASNTTSVEPVWEDKSLRQHNLLGDPSIDIWTRMPQSMALNYTNTENSTLITTTSMVNQSLSNATVSLTAGSEILWRGITNKNGSVLLPLTIAELESINCTLTVSKDNYIPQQMVWATPETSTTSSSSTSITTSASTSSSSATTSIDTSTDSTTQTSADSDSSSKETNSTAPDSNSNSNSGAEFFTASFTYLFTISGIIVVLLVGKRRR